MMNEKTLQYYQNKREEVLKAIDPICKAFGIAWCDYKIDVNTGAEVLCINQTKIGCTGNAVSAVVDELIAYIFVARYCKNRCLGAFHKQTLNQIKKYWISED